jgi:hypothetical protein
MFNTTENSSDTSTQTVANSSATIIAFDAAIRPTTVEPSSAHAFTDFILAQLNCTVLRFKIITNEIEATAAALSGGMITAEQAILILAETGLPLADEVSS